MSTVRMRRKTEPHLAQFHLVFQRMRENKSIFCSKCEDHVNGNPPVVCYRKWQARQIARGFVDNTINSMLETWENRPFDASNFVDECENEGQVSLVRVPPSSILSY